MTLMWLIFMPLLYLLLTRVAGWPAVLAVIISTPIFLVWVPVSYPLMLIGNEKFQRGENPQLSSVGMAMAALLGLATILLSTLAFLLYASFRSGSYFMLAVVITLAFLAIVAVVLIVKRLLGELRPQPADGPS